jgi:hypothetical protein
LPTIRWTKVAFEWIGVAVGKTACRFLLLLRLIFLRCGKWIVVRFRSVGILFPSGVSKRRCHIIFLSILVLVVVIVVL